MISVGIKIGDGRISDSHKYYGLVYVSSDNRFNAPLKPLESTTYPEEEGEHVYNLGVEDAFDYKVVWFVRGINDISDANTTINRFNGLLFEKAEGSNAKKFKQVEFYNYYKKVKIVGIPSLISEATEFWRDANGVQHDVVLVEWTIRVTKPSLCNFNYTNTIAYDIPDYES